LTVTRSDNDGLVDCQEFGTLCARSPGPPNLSYAEAYFNGDEMHAIKKGMNILDRIQVSHMAQLQNMLDFPPAPKLDELGHLIPSKAAESELRGEQLFFGKAKCAACHPAPFYLDNLTQDLPLERFTNEATDGEIKTFYLTGNQRESAVPA
jgi:hypothetical protein